MMASSSQYKEGSMTITVSSLLAMFPGCYVVLYVSPNLAVFPYEDNSAYVDFSVFSFTWFGTLNHISAWLYEPGEVE